MRKYNLKVEKNPEVPKKLFKFAGPLPEKVDLSNKLPPVFNQGDLGSCTANALCGSFMYDDPTFSASRLFVYYNERLLDGSISSDAGSSLTQGIHALKKYGASSENHWPYDITKFTIRPVKNAYTEALEHQVLSAEHVNQNTESIKGCLFSGYPIVVGIAVYKSLDSTSASRTGVVTMPKKGEKVLGYHAVLICGYDDLKGVFIVRNSWGSSWGDHGNFYLPYAYLTDKNLATDLWKITKVEIPGKVKEESFIRKILKKFSFFT